jgi:glycine cleavage system aminomethyltransferase T
LRAISQPKFCCTLGAGYSDPDFRSFFYAPTAVTGSVDPANLRARFRTPVEVGWQRTVRFDHDFVGRKALEEEIANPRRTVVIPRWT